LHQSTHNRKINVQNKEVPEINTKKKTGGGNFPIEPSKKRKFLKATVVTPVWTVDVEDKLA
jgi:hypothetical protein